MSEGWGWLYSGMISYETRLLIHNLKLYDSRQEPGFVKVKLLN